MCWNITQDVNNEPYFRRGEYQFVLINSNESKKTLMGSSVNTSSVIVKCSNSFAKLRHFRNLLIFQSLFPSSRHSLTLLLSYSKICHVPVTGQPHMGRWKLIWRTHRKSFNCKLNEIHFTHSHC